MKRAVYSMLIVFLAVTLHFSASAQCPQTACSSDLVHCMSGVGACGTASPSCSSNLVVPNFTWSKSGSTVTIQNLALCYWGPPGTTPPWSTTLIAGRLMNLSLRPSATRTFNLTNGLGSTFQCTVEANGLWSVRLTAGATPAQGTNLYGGSYTL